MMKTLLSLAALWMIVGVASCQKADVEPEPEPQICWQDCSDGTYVAGDVLVGMREASTLPQTFQLFNSNSLIVKSVMGPLYISSLPADSIDYVVRELNRKPYINSGAWKAVKDGNVYLHYQTHALTVIPRLLDMTVANQQDWAATVQRLQLQEQPTMVKSCHLNVPLCSEKYWVSQLQPNPLVKWVELNKIVRIQPGG
ncbi:hypothetical protein J0X19_03995 [Hymenobacter sp. BT186]|uniref:Uncharacterized protein n=1 Tax=Hymenobacter telluris TaxID=2816474 RepID=A0A939EWB7_9BACT|nr:hypothetical protein [Hymenobacter telluris]MBO0357098.1 hypothetical protein [Hymenobacter telluris]MBW3373125.1 hypothetical protein [Hymenobacter norwichensis]